MAITSALVLYAVIWFLTFLIVLPFRVKTQGDLGEIVPGTHAGAPEVHNVRRKAWLTSGIALVIWVIVAGIIIFEVLTLDDIDLFHRWNSDYSG